MTDDDAGAEAASPACGSVPSRCIRRGGILIPFVIAFVILGFISGPFLRFQNLANILDQQSGIIIVAAAGTLVLIAGGIDLSVGAIYGLAGATAAQLAVSFGPPVGDPGGIPSGW